MQIHERVWERPQPTWRPLATYGFLAAMAVAYLIQVQMLRAGNGEGMLELFVIATDWFVRPWTLITSTLAHGSANHLFFNGLMLFFMGPLAERTIGRRNFLILLFVSGALSGIVQVHLSSLTGGAGAALGASGALMAMFGVLVRFYPKQKVLLFGIIPLQFYVVALLYLAMDVLGAFDPNNGIGNFAHLGGLAIGYLAAPALRKETPNTYWQQR